MTVFLKVSLLVCLTGTATTTFADAAGTAWVEKSDRFRSPAETFSVSVKVVDTRGSEKKESQYRVATKGHDLTLVEQTAPDRQRGRKLLMKAHDLWLYSPNVSRPTRISFEQKLTGEVSNGDLMRTNFADDYDAAVTKSSSPADAKTVQLHLTPKNKSVTYNSIDYWVDRASSRPVRAIFYALSGKAIKTANYLEFKLALGAPRLTKVEITDALETKRKSMMFYADFKKEKFDDSYFSKESLAR